jgi:hypothetical protein
MEKNRQEEGSNCFSYFRPKQLKPNESLERRAATTPLFEEIQMLRLKSQKSASMLTETSSAQHNASYYDKMESLKAKIILAHKRVNMAEVKQTLDDIRKQEELTC